MSNRRRRISEMAAPWPDASDSSAVVHNTDHGFNHPNRSPDDDSRYVVKLTHESNWYMADVEKNIGLYQMGDVLFVDYDSEDPEDEFEMENWTSRLYLMPYEKDSDKCLEQIAYLFGGSLAVEVMTFEEYESEAG